MTPVKGGEQVGGTTRRTMPTRMQSCGAKSGSSGRRTVRTFLSAKLAFLPDGNLEACVVKLTLSPPDVISNCTYGCATACVVVFCCRRCCRCFVVVDVGSGCGGVVAIVEQYPFRSLLRDRCRHPCLTCAVTRAVAGHEKEVEHKVSPVKMNSKVRCT